MCVQIGTAEPRTDNRPWWHARASVLLATAVVLLAGCAINSVATPDRTIPPLPNEPVNTLPATPDTVRIALDVKADRPATITWTDGDTIHTDQITDKDLAGGDAVKGFTFDTTQPYLAVATVTAGSAGKLSCNMNATSPAGGNYGGMGRSTKTRPSVMCAVHADQSEATPSRGSHSVTIDATGTSGHTWAGWATQFSSGEDNPHLFTPVVVNQDSGTIRAVVVTSRPSDTATCRILIDGQEQAHGTAHGTNSMALCSATIS